MGNELVTLKRQQAQNRPTQPSYQNPSYNRPQYQNPTPYNSNRPINGPTPINPNANPDRTMVTQNNLAQEQVYCAYCNYEKCICHGGEPSHVLVTQDQPLV
jgi:hypothetical protein